eukprot:m.9268 g.9268  ORF g.9268 m.9268 type:complete len:51 (+) comp21226_c0_seq2:171-323(+)
MARIPETIPEIERNGGGCLIQERRGEGVRVYQLGLPAFAFTRIPAVPFCQ